MVRVEAQSPEEAKPLSRHPQTAKVAVAAGYAAETLGLIGFLTFNGFTTLQLISDITIVLIAAGLLLPSAGMLVLRSRFARNLAAVRNSFLLQGLGMAVLFLGVLLAFGFSSLTGYVIGVTLLVASTALSLFGVFLLRRNHAGVDFWRPREVNYLTLGTVLLLSGVGVIMASNIAFYYVLSEVSNTIYVDLGATISAIGCVVGAYSFINPF
jgi:hypothetical protein